MSRFHRFRHFFLISYLSPILQLIAHGIDHHKQGGYSTFVALCRSIPFLSFLQGLYFIYIVNSSRHNSNLSPCSLLFFLASFILNRQPDCKQCFTSTFELDAHVNTDHTHPLSFVTYIFLSLSLGFFFRIFLFNVVLLIIRLFILHFFW